MPVFSVQETLEYAIQATLSETYGEDEDIEVNWHLTTMTIEVQCENCEESRPEVVWRLNLVFFYGAEEDRRVTSIMGTLPYEMCSDADPEPMAALVKRIVEDFQFSTLMLTDGLDAELTQAAEGPESSS